MTEFYGYRNNPNVAKKSRNISFGRAVIEGSIAGPDWRVIDENGEEVNRGDQNFGHTHAGREVCMGVLTDRIGYVDDYQDPTLVKWAETKPLDESPHPLVSILDSEYRIFGSGGQGMHRWGE